MISESELSCPEILTELPAAENDRIFKKGASL
jgi:hypothetical protein